MTEWREISGQQGRYSVSTAGQIRNAAGKELAPNSARGYVTVQLCGRKRFTVHRLVAETFIGPRPIGAQINHKNGIKSDNRLENLEYCSGSENMKHCFATGLQSNHGERHSQSKLTEEKVAQIRRLIADGASNKEIAQMMSVDPSNISHIKRGKTWASPTLQINMAAAGENPAAVV